MATLLSRVRIPLAVAAGSAILLSGAAASTQSSHFNTSAITVGPGGYRLNFSVVWTCDDAPQTTTSAPGQIDLVDATGTLVGRVSATVSSSTPIIQVQGTGAVSGAVGRASQVGAGGTPAIATLQGTWNIPALSGGPYSLRFWFFQEAQGGPASTIMTQAADAGASGPIGPPSVTLSAPSSAVALAPVAMTANAAVSADGNPLASVLLEASLDGGATWSVVHNDASPANPADVETGSYAFAQSGTGLLRAVATDTTGLQASSTTELTVAKAAQGPVSVSPANSSIVAGESVSFVASGGATGTYSWSGSASGTGPSQSVSFAETGSYAVSVADDGNATYAPSSPATALVTVSAPFFTLSLSADTGGSVSGGGSYASGSQATAAATPDSSHAFAGWTGDVTASTASVSLVMNANKALTAHFTALLQQSIAWVPPAAVSTQSPPFALVVSASSGLPVTLALDSGPITLAGNQVSVNGTTGQVSITATQPGNAVYLPAPPVVITFAVGNPPAGAVFSDDSTATKRSDRETRITAFTSGKAR